MTSDKRKKESGGLDRHYKKKKAIDIESDDELESAHYFYENGLRKVKPYYHTYTTYAKGRWLGSTLLNVYEKEFMDSPKEYYRLAIECGNIRVNGQLVPTDYTVRNMDLIENTQHRHEPPVTGKPVRILYETADFVVIDKPASVPVHPTGRYRHNSILHIVQKEIGVKVFSINRLDRLTSGVMVLAKKREKIRELEILFRERVVKKEYICRVKGEFPTDPIIVDQPLKVFSHKLGLNCVHPDGKPSITKFKRISYNGRTSVVLAQPITGRTHQIRVHLQWLAHPIINDPLYANPKIWRKISNVVDVAHGRLKGELVPKWGEQNAQRIYSDQELEAVAKTVQQLREMNDSDLVSLVSSPNGEQNQISVDCEASTSSISDRENPSPSHPAIPYLPRPQSIFPTCPACHTPLLPDPEPHQLQIYLHAKSYDYTIGANSTIEFPPSCLIDQDEIELEPSMMSLIDQRRYAEENGATKVYRFETDLPEWASEDYSGDLKWFDGGDVDVPAV